MERNIRKLIAVFEMLCGVIGVLVSLITLFKVGFTKGIGVIVLLLTVHVLLVLAGILLWREKRLGYKLSILVQTLQLPIIISQSILYDFSTLFRVGLAIESSHNTLKLKFLTNLGSFLRFSTNAKTEGFVIGINILAFILIGYFLHSLNKTTYSNTSNC